MRGSSCGHGVRMGGGVGGEGDGAYGGADGEVPAEL